MTLKTIARRYAIALFDVLQRTGDQGRAEQDLEAIRRLFAEHGELAKVFETPAVPASKKRAIVSAVIEAGGDITPQVRRLLLMLAERDRLSLVPDIADAYAERVRQLRRVVTVELTTAMHLPHSQRATLVAALGRAAGADVALTERVDPALIGGVVARVGSVVFDGSVLTQIERMRRRLIGAGETGR